MANNWDFGTALNELKVGGKLTRSGWNGAKQHLELQVPDENSKMSLPYIFITTVQGDRVPWLASQTDLLADDWGPAPVDAELSEVSEKIGSEQSS